MTGPDGPPLAGAPVGRVGLDREGGAQAGTRVFGLSFHTRLVLDLVAAAMLPLAVFGLVQILVGAADPTSGPRILLLALAITAALGILVAHLVALDLSAPLRALAAAAIRVGAGKHVEPVQVPGGDLLARLVEGQNRLGADMERRNRQLADVLASVATVTPSEGVDRLLARAASDARSAFGLIDARVQLVDPATIPEEERIPGEALPIRAELRAGAERLGLLHGHLPPTYAWEPADQALLDLFAREVGVAVRNAELFARVEVQNSQLRELAEAKDDFLRGVSHNLQTPLTSIRLYADQLAGATQDHRAEIIGEQTFGTGTVLARFDLADGSSLRVGTVMWLTRNGRPLWNEGLLPDIEVELADDAPRFRPRDVAELTAAEVPSVADTQLRRALREVAAAR